MLTPQQVNRLVIEFDVDRELPVLKRAGFIETETRLIHPEIELSLPVLRWHPGEEEPDLYPVASELRGRWNQDPVETEVIVATKDARRLCGGYNGKPRASEWRHDVAMSSVYLKYLAEDQERAARWVSGDELRAVKQWHFGERVPDAVIASSDGNEVERIVEMGGNYNRQKLEAMHAEFQIAPYEIW